MTFSDALAFTLKWEGGYSNHVADSGGATNYGVTQNTYNKYRKEQGLSPRAVRNIELEEVKDIYYEMYWLPSKSGTMHEPLGIVYFDTVVNFGLGGGAKLMQRALGVADDGAWGPGTQKAFLKANNMDTAVKLCQERIARRYELVARNPRLRVFLKGWLRRDNELTQYMKRFA